ncbi:MAG: MlaC/ttg2D family ABC transporter substrate-binding protein [Alphaproteobacteria bacterium]
MLRRSVLKSFTSGVTLSLVAGGAGAWLADVPTASAQEQPVATMQSLAAYTIQTVGNRAFPLATRRQYATQIIDQRFNTAKLGQLALGTIWRRMNNQQKQAFLVKFRELMVEDFVWWFSDYDGQSYRVVGAKRDRSDPNTVFVDVEYKRGSQSVITNWRAESEGGIYKILDIKVAGLSLLNQLRGEYRSAYSNGGVNQVMRFMDKHINKRRQQLS